MSSKTAFAREVGCQYTGPNDVQCYVSCGDSRLVHFDVHAPEEAVEYYPPQWSRDMLASRVVSKPEASVSQGKGGVFRSSDVHYFYSLLYHFAYHGKKVRPLPKWRSFSSATTPATRVGDCAHGVVCHANSL